MYKPPHIPLTMLTELINKQKAQVLIAEDMLFTLTKRYALQRLGFRPECWPKVRMKDGRPMYFERWDRDWYTGTAEAIVLHLTKKGTWRKTYDRIPWDECSGWRHGWPDNLKM
jgi:hypothetical protein